MEPIKFPESNKTLEKPTGMTEEECGSLSVYNDGKQSVSCWKMTLKDRINALLFGKIWLYVMSGKTQPPVWISSAKTVFKNKKV